MFFQTQIVNLYRFLTSQTRKFTSLRKPYMYICRNKLVYYHIVKDFGRIYFSLLKCKNSYSKWRGKLIHIRIKIAKTCR